MTQHKYKRFTQYYEDNKLDDDEIIIYSHPKLNKKERKWKRFINYIIYTICGRKYAKKLYKIES